MTDTWTKEERLVGGEIEREFYGKRDGERNREKE